MAINNAKHIIGEINGVRCTIIESGVTLERAAFLTQLLEYNNLEVLREKVHSEQDGAEERFTIGVTDLVFNPVFAIYEKLLKNPEGGFVTPKYWNQECVECDPRYWIMKKKNS